MSAFSLLVLFSMSYVIIPYFFYDNKAVEAVFISVIDFQISDL